MDMDGHNFTNGRQYVKSHKTFIVLYFISVMYYEMAFIAQSNAAKKMCRDILEFERCIMCHSMAFNMGNVE